MSRGNVDVLRTMHRTRTQISSSSSNDSKLRLKTGLSRSFFQSTPLSKRSKDTEFQDISQLLDIIENQRSSLEERAEIIKKLQSDINALGKMLVEERSKATQYSHMCVMAEKELEEVKSKAKNEPLTISQLTQLPLPPQVFETPPVEKKLAQENFILKTDLDNIQHQLQLKVAELNSRVEEYESISQLLQSQVIWLNKENSKLLQAAAEKEVRCKDAEVKLQLALTENIQKTETIERMNVESQNRRLEIEKRNKEIKEIKETVGYLQQITDKSSFQLKLSSFNEEELRRKIQYFKSEALHIADRLGSAVKDKSVWEERFRAELQVRETLLATIEDLRRERMEEKSRLLLEVEEARQHAKTHSSNLLELEDELRKKGEGVEKLGTTLKSKDETIDSFADEITRLKAENDSLRSQLANCEPSVQAAKAELERLEAELTQSEIQTADYGQLQYENDQLNMRILALEKDKADIRKAVETAESRKSEAEQQLKAAKTALKEWEIGMNDIRLEMTEMKTMKTKCQQMQETINAGEEEKKILHAEVRGRQIAKKMQEFDEANRMVSELRHSTDHLSKTCEDLKEKVTQLTADLHSQLPDRHEIEAKLLQIQLREDEIKAAIARTANATRAIESDLCCIVCLSIVEDAVLCIPCGHFYCKKCREGYHPHCQQCGQGKKVKATMKVAILDDIATKIVYKKKTIAAILE